MFLCYKDRVRFQIKVLDILHRIILLESLSYSHPLSKPKENWQLKITFFRNKTLAQMTDKIFHLLAYLLITMFINSKHICTPAVSPCMQSSSLSS